MNERFSFSVRECVMLMLTCGALQIGAYYFAGAMASSGAHLPVPQPDTLLYCQSARQIAEGTPFVYTPGDKPSTGCTSHLYPFLLAALYKAGLTGDALLTGGFALNALFYLLFLANWGVIAGRLASSPVTRAGACALLALNGHAAFSSLAQSDVGMWLAVSSGLFVALLAGRTGWFGVLLALSPWCRPEGAVLSLMYAGALTVRRAMRLRVSGAEWGAAAAGLASSAGVFAFNDWLTGMAQFHSVVNKGYFKQYDLPSALFLTLGDALRIARELLMGMPDKLPRELIFLPLISALAAWLGFLVRPWRDGGRQAWKEAWWLAGCAGAIGTVASSGWQNTNTDRYLAWLLPIWLLYMAEGAHWAAGRLPNAVSRALPILVLGLFQAVSALAFVSLYHSVCLSTQQQYEFGKEAHAAIPPGARVGGEMGVGVAYGMPGHRVVHLSGIYSPDLLASDAVLNLERLKHRPEARFEYWLFATDRAELEDASVEALCGPTEVVGLDGANLRPAAWEALDRARTPPDGEVAADGWRLADAVDVGWPEDEARTGYEVFSRFNGAVCKPFAVAGRSGTNQLFEVGRVVLGGDSMSVRLTPGRPVRVVLRTAGKASAGVRLGFNSWPRTFSFASPLKLNVQADGVAAGRVEARLLTTNATEFAEVRFTVPAEAVRESVTRFAFFGDHAALAYWFYQPQP